MSAVSMRTGARMGACLLMALAVVLLAGCNKSWSPEDERATYKSSYQRTADGAYRVRRGDTLHAIAFSFVLDWRDIARWNGISAPYTIYPDQELSLKEPKRGADTKAARVPEPAKSKEVTTAPVKPPAPAVSTPAPKSQTPSSAQTKPTQSTRPKPVATSDPSKWRWPTEGRILSNFRSNDPSRNGIEIAGKEGQPIVATAAGEVVYSGSGLLGYGELIIIKHSDRLLSAYAHNRKRLVAEGQAVSSGEKIAEMGRDERNREMLHFEIRLNGTPQDPLKYLPRK